MANMAIESMDDIKDIVNTFIRQIKYDKLASDMHETRFKTMEKRMEKKENTHTHTQTLINCYLLRLNQLDINWNFYV